MSEAATAGPAEIITEYMILPTGCDPATAPYAYHGFAVYVRWNGELGWTVTGMTREERLSVKGRKWAQFVPARNRRHYYFRTFEAARQAALEAVDQRTVHGRTWAEFVQWADEQRAQRAAQG